MTMPPQQKPPYSQMAILGFVLSFISGFIGSIISIIALVRLKTSGLRGKGLAISGIIVGIVTTILSWMMIAGVLISVANMESGSSVESIVASSQSSTLEPPQHATPTASPEAVAETSLAAASPDPADETIGDYCAAIIAFGTIANNPSSSPESIMASFTAVRDTTDNLVVKEKTQQVIDSGLTGDEAAMDEAISILGPELEKDFNECSNK